MSKGLSNGAKAGVTLAVLAGLVVLIGVPIAVHKRRKAAARRLADELDSRAKLMPPRVSESSEDSAERGQNRRCCALP